MNDRIFFLGVSVGFTAAVLLYAVLRFFAPWLRGLCCGAHVSLLYIVGMRLRGTPPGFLIDACRSLVHSGCRVSMREIESCYIAEGHTIRRDNIDGFIALVKQRVGERRGD